MTDYIGQPLEDDEYLLKIRIEEQAVNTGFLTKLTKKKELPKAFVDWPNNKYHQPKRITLPIYVHKEIFKFGWKILSWRFGESQNWATMIHPDGFTVEIYLTNLLGIIKSCTVIDGELQGEFLWEDHKLIIKK